MSQTLIHKRYSGRILLALALVATGCFVWLFARVTAQTFAAEDAAAASQIVGRYFAADTAEIEAIARGEKPSNAFRNSINRGLDANIFFGFKIFDTSGRLRFEATPAANNRLTARSSAQLDAKTLKVASTGRPLTQTGEVNFATGTRYLADTVSPVPREGKVVAIQEIYIEQTERLNQLRERITNLTLLAATLAAIAFGIPAMAWRRKSADLAQREAEIEIQARQFKTAFDNLPQGITLYDNQRNLAVANTAYARIFGLQPEAMRPGICADDVRGLRLQHGARVLTDYEKEAIPRLSNGIEHAAEVWKLPDGRVVRTFRYPVPGGGWVSLHEDVTEELKQKEELDTARRFLDTVIENIPAAIIVKDASSLRYELANRAVETVHGVPRDEILGKCARDLFEPAQAERIDRTDREVLARNESEAFANEGVVLTPGRGERIIATKRLAIRKPNGEAAWLITIVEDVTDRRNADARINFLAHHDALTGLGNRAAFQECLDKALEEVALKDEGAGLALALFDLDGFKEINDTFGHEAGDVVLRHIGGVLARNIQPGDTAARLGGDEFAILFRSATTEEQVDEVLAKMLSDMSEPLMHETSKMLIAASAGVALHRTGAEADRKTLMRQADLALYEAKSQGKGVYCTYVPDIMERRLSRKALERDMHDALANDQFELHYQPIVDLRTGAIVSMEALVRWRHPERGLIPPLDFIPIAEESGLIVPLGEIVLEKACRAAAQWPSHIRVSVNLSPIQFRDRNLAIKISKVLMQSRLLPQRLELEITEAALLDDSFDNIQLLTELRSTGIRIVMDDFGTGYSSLNYLRNFPFDKIKIDRSYVRDLEQGANHSRTILGAVLAMAQGLDLSTTAEGVETKEQMDILRSAGCTEMQGYFFSRPVPLPDLAALFARDKDRRPAQPAAA